MEKRTLTLYTLGGMSILLLSVMILSAYQGERSEKPVAAISSGGLPQVVESINLNRPFSFAGEELPMDNFDVRERLDRELLVNSYWHSSTLLHIKRAHRFFPLIEPILAKNGIPDDFKYLAIAESSLENASSPAGAKGIWQFMPSTGKSYGLEINNEVDERYHYEKATEAFCDYIQDLYDRFGSWTTAAAAYNTGETNMRREIEAQQSERYYDLNLHTETMRYVFRLVAIKQILSQPRAFGFYLETKDLYPPLDNYREVVVDGSIESLGNFAAQHKISYRMLKVYNPWLLTSRLTNSGQKEYVIKVPRIQVGQ